MIKYSDGHIRIKLIYYSDDDVIIVGHELSHELLITVYNIINIKILKCFDLGAYYNIPT